MKEIALSNSDKVALVDDEDFGRLSQYKWCANTFPKRKVMYPVRTVSKGFTSSERYMHYHIWEMRPGFVVDHINGNGLDNQKSNLRYATHSQNLMNKSKDKHLSSRYKGVSRFHNVWLVQLRVSGVPFIVGCFPCEFCAALAYDMAAIKHFGEFARPNILSAPIA